MLGPDCLGKFPMVRSVFKDRYEMDVTPKRHSDRPRLTVAVRRGLEVVWALASADVQASDGEVPPRWTARDREELERALVYLSYLARRPMPKAD